MSEGKKKFFISQRTLVIIMILVMAGIATSFIFRVMSHGYR